MISETVRVDRAANSRSILVVDDDIDVRSMLVEVLGLEGYSVEGADGGESALVRLRRGFIPGLILLDLLMPEMDGFQFRAAQLADRRLARIPVVVFSADSRLDGEALSMGVTRLLRKPVDLDVLLDAVGAHCCAWA